ncbi:MAG: HNH endonuclease [Alphaproteobacteria bacterium]|nr:HNH endonuclease [Alphaproteobacteria bacterium]
MRSNRPYRPEIFLRKLKELRASRRQATQEWRERRPLRTSLSSADREAVFAKTGGRCHLCGGTLNKKWAVDHVQPYALGGTDSLDNFLPAHSRCNGNRRSTTEVEFQLTLALGRWLLTEIANESKLGEQAYQDYRRRLQLNAKRRSQ